MGKPFTFYALFRINLSGLFTIFPIYSAVQKVQDVFVVSQQDKFTLSRANWLQPDRVASPTLDRRHGDQCLMDVFVFPPHPLTDTQSQNKALLLKQVQMCKKNTRGERTRDVLHS